MPLPVVRMVVGRFRGSTGDERAVEENSENSGEAAESDEHTTLVVDADSAAANSATQVTTVVSRYSGARRSAARGRSPMPGRCASSTGCGFRPTDYAEAGPDLADP